MENSLTSLGNSKTKYQYEKPDSSILECFENPFGDETVNRNNVHGTIHIEAPEFTCVCPITGQPDFGIIIVDYKPGKLALESKSLKLYLMGFRMFGTFHEAVVNRIANDLVTLLDPVWLKVEGRFAPRGGIAFHPKAKYKNPSIKG